MSQSSSKPLSQSNSKRGKNWSDAEDEQVCRSWLAISKDSIRGTDQQRGDFWKAVKEHAQAHISSFENRPADGIRQRFGTISQQVAKFVGCLAFVNRLNASGTSKEDRYQEARSMFLKETSQKVFRIQGCYEILKDEPKYKDLQDSKELMKRKRKENIAQISVEEPISGGEEPQPSSSRSIPNPRPMGQKKAKNVNQNNSEVSWNELLQEMKKKNEILERQTYEIQRASDLKIITTPTEGLDEISKSLLIQLKAELVVKFNADSSTEEFVEEDVPYEQFLFDEEQVITYSANESDEEGQACD